jgi:hypothetical protein
MSAFWEVIEHLGDLGKVIPVIAAVVALPKAWRRWSTWRAQRSSTSLQKKILEIERLSKSPSARSDLMQNRLFLLFMLLGLWLMMQGLGFDASGRQLVLAVDVVCGAAMYLLAAATMGQMKDIQRAAETIDKLKHRLSKLPADEP